MLPFFLYVIFFFQRAKTKTMAEAKIFGVGGMITSGIVDALKKSYKSLPETLEAFKQKHPNWKELIATQRRKREGTTEEEHKGHQGHHGHGHHGHHKHHEEPAATSFAAPPAAPEAAVVAAPAKEELVEPAKPPAHAPEVHARAEETVNEATDLNTAEEAETQAPVAALPEPGTPVRVARSTSEFESPDPTARFQHDARGTGSCLLLLPCYILILPFPLCISFMYI